MNVDDFHHIQSPIQEVEFWKDLSEQSTIISTKSMAIEIHSILKPVLSVFEYLQKHHNGTSTCDAKDGIHTGTNTCTNGANTLIKADQINRPRDDYSDNNVPLLQHQFHHSSFDFLDQHFTDGNCIETALYDMFQVVDKHGNFIYSALVCIDVR